MKIKVYLLALLMVVGLFQGCDDDDDDMISVPETVWTAFSQKYPDFRVTEWEYEHGYYKADFRNNGAEAEAWFQTSGQWVRTETDLAVAALPLAVQSYLSATYSGYRVDDADWVETPAGDFYEIELEKAGQPDVYLQLTADGQPLN